MRDTTPSRSDTTSSSLFSNRNNILATPSPPDARLVSLTVPAMVKNWPPITLVGMPRPLSIICIERVLGSIFILMSPDFSVPFSIAPLIASKEFWNSSFMDTAAIFSGVPYSLDPSILAKRATSADGCTRVWLVAAWVPVSLMLPPISRALRSWSVAKIRSDNALIESLPMPNIRRMLSTNRLNRCVSPSTPLVLSRKSCMVLSVMP